MGQEEPSDDDGFDIAVGVDEGGHWMAVETHGRAGGYFVSRREALRYAVTLLDQRPGRIRVAHHRLAAFPRH